MPQRRPAVVETAELEELDAIVELDEWPMVEDDSDVDAEVDAIVDADVDEVVLEVTARLEAAELEAEVEPDAAPVAAAVVEEFGETVTHGAQSVVVGVVEAE